MQRRSERQRDRCGSGRAREAGCAENGTGFARVRGHARSHSDRANFQTLCKTVAPTGIGPALEFCIGRLFQEENACAVETVLGTTLVVVCLYSAHGRASTARLRYPTRELLSHQPLTAHLPLANNRPQLYDNT